MKSYDLYVKDAIIPCAVEISISKNNDYETGHMVKVVHHKFSDKSGQMEEETMNCNIEDIEFREIIY